MKWISDETVRHLKDVASLPDLSGTAYRMVEKIAQGGMGTIYVVFDTRLGRKVALKVASGVEASRETLSRLEREARIVATLEHPGIVPIHDYGMLPDGRTFYVMKLVRGERLDQIVGRGAPLAETLRAFERICEAVAFAHAHGVIHRDLKPENVMIGPFGEVLVMDWGVAKLKGYVDPPSAAAKADSPPEGGTAHGTVLGTPAYMAPEQSQGRLDLVDEITDGYALGAILYFILTRRAPVEADSPETGRGAMAAARPDRPRALTPEVPRRLEAICLKAMSRERGARYSSAAELGADVARFLSGERVEAYRETPFERAGRWAYRHRTPIALVVAYLVMRTVLFFFFRF